jgi:hypothetical protein
MLDLGGQGQANRALPPLEEVGEPAVGDDDVRERVGGEGDIGERLLVWGLGQAELEHADRLPPVGHRRVQANLAGADLDLYRLLEERASMRGAGQGHQLGSLVALGSDRARDAGVPEPDQRPAAEVDDQEGDRVGAERPGQPPAENVGGVDRRGVLDGVEQSREVGPRCEKVRHRAHLDAGRRQRRTACAGSSS